MRRLLLALLLVLTPPVLGQTPQPVDVDYQCAGSTDPNNDPLNFQWVITPTGPTLTNADQQVVTVTWNAPGMFDLTCAVDDGSETTPADNPLTVTVTIANLPPTPPTIIGPSDVVLPVATLWGPPPYMLDPTSGAIDCCSCDVLAENSLTQIVDFRGATRPARLHDELPGPDNDPDWFTSWPEDEYPEMANGSTGWCDAGAVEMHATDYITEAPPDVALRAWPPQSPIGEDMWDALWSFCAGEGDECEFDGTVDVAYGVDGQFIHRRLTDGAMCTGEAIMWPFAFTDEVPGLHCWFV